MSQIKQLLRFHKQGDSIKSIARNLGISRNTLKVYISKLEAGKIPIAELLEMEDSQLINTEIDLFSSNKTKTCL